MKRKVEPYVDDPQCPKCGHFNVTRFFERMQDENDEESSGTEGDILQWNCRRCGYRWYTHCMDHGDSSPCQSSACSGLHAEIICLQRQLAKSREVTKIRDQQLHDEIVRVARLAEALDAYCAMTVKKGKIAAVGVDSPVDNWREFVKPMELAEYNRTYNALFPPGSLS